MARKPIPNPDVAVLNPDGTMTRSWYDYFLERDRLNLGDLRDVSPAAPANGQVPIWNASTKKWTPGAN
jgi:hypothetical protein